MEKFKRPIHSYVALKDGKFVGATISATEPNVKVEWKDDMEEWWRDMVMAGCVIVTTFTGEEYMNLVNESRNHGL